MEKQRRELIYKQIVNRIMQDIYDGVLTYGDKLPSIRECVKRFEVSKTSVESAYEVLLEDGYIRSIANKGYYVDVSKEALKNRTFILSEESVKEKEYRYMLTSDAIDVESFDFSSWKHYIKEAMEEKQKLSQYGDTQGELILRKALQQYAYHQRGVIAKVENIIVGASYQSLLYLLGSLLDRKIIAFEKNGFEQAEQVFSDMDYPIHILKRSEPFSLTNLIQSQAKLCYLNSSACGKYRSALTSEQRKSLLTWCEEKEHYLIEDDHNGELRYATSISPALQGFDTSGKVIYLGSFSKVLLPSLRVAYMVLPDALMEKYQTKKQYYSPSASKLEQIALANYIAQGNLDRHIKRVRKRYAHKQQVMYQLLHTYFREDFIYLEETSFQYVVEFKYSINRDCKEMMENKGIKIDINEERMKISFSIIQEEEMEVMIQEVHHLIKGEGI